MHDAHTNWILTNSVCWYVDISMFDFKVVPPSSMSDYTSVYPVILRCIIFVNANIFCHQRCSAFHPPPCRVPPYSMARSILLHVTFHPPPCRVPSSSPCLIIGLHLFLFFSWCVLYLWLQRSLRHQICWVFHPPCLTWWRRLWVVCLEYLPPQTSIRLLLLPPVWCPSSTQAWAVCYPAWEWAWAWVWACHLCHQQ